MSNLYYCFDATEKDRLVSQGCRVVREKTIDGRQCWIMHSPDDSLEKFAEDKQNVAPMQFMTF
jgi:hypothetical protein